MRSGRWPSSESDRAQSHVLASSTSISRDMGASVISNRLSGDRTVGDEDVKVRIDEGVRTETHHVVGGDRGRFLRVPAL